MKSIYKDAVDVEWHEWPCVATCWEVAASEYRISNTVYTIKNFHYPLNSEMAEYLNWCNKLGADAFYADSDDFYFRNPEDAVAFKLTFGIQS